MIQITLYDDDLVIGTLEMDAAASYVHRITDVKVTGMKRNKNKQIVASHTYEFFNSKSKKWKNMNDEIGFLKNELAYLMDNSWEN